MDKFEKMLVMQDIMKIEKCIKHMEEVLETYEDIDTRFYCIPIEMATAKSTMKRISAGLKDFLNEIDKKDFNDGETRGSY